jgi:hypothetical protein
MAAQTEIDALAQEILTSTAEMFNNAPQMPIITGGDAERTKRMTDKYVDGTVMTKCGSVLTAGLMVEYMAREIARLRTQISEENYKKSKAVSKARETREKNKLAKKAAAKEGWVPDGPAAE